MSKFCPFCDDVKDSNLDSPEALKEHIKDEHAKQIVELGKPKDLSYDDETKELQQKYLETGES